MIRSIDHTRPAPTLIVFAAEDRTELFVAHSNVVHVGRGAENDLVIDHPSVSRTHAILRFEAEATVEDLGSATGTTIASLPVPPHRAVTWTDGTWVALGGAARLLRVAEPLGPRR